MISIIISIYNIEKYLRRCLSSIAENNLENTEVLLIDDGSTDSTPQICKDFCNINRVFNYYRKTNGGCTSARNYGLALSKGNYVFFIDGDDWIEPDLLSKTKSVIDLYHPGIINFNYYKEYDNFNTKETSSIYSGLKIDDELKKVKQTLLYNENMDFFRFSVLPAFWSKIIKKELIDKNVCLREEIVFGEDLCVTLFALNDAKSIFFMDEFLYHYRQNIDSITKSYDKRRNSKIKYLIDYLDNRIPMMENDYSKQYYYYRLFLFQTCILNESKRIRVSESKDKLLEAMDVLSFNENLSKISKVKSSSVNFLFFLIKLKMYYIALVVVRIAFSFKKRKFKNR